MLAARNVLMNNLNYVALGVHLSRKAEGPGNQGTGMKDHHQWKNNLHTTVVDANSNDPFMPCQCCDGHTRQDYSLQDDVEDCLSPCLSPSSPSTDSSSSSDFTLNDSPVSMYYKEYSQENISSPDQPDIIPLDLDLSPETEASTSPLVVKTTPAEDCTTPENLNNNFCESAEDGIIAHTLDRNSNTLEVKPTFIDDPVTETGTPLIPEDQLGNVNLLATGGTRCSEDEELLPGFSFSEIISAQTPKKTITSFHELAQKRRRSTGAFPPQPKNDRSDWLIVFSPDTDQPPLNELTASAFFHGDLVDQNHPVSMGKGVTTFRELRYRNMLNKHSSQLGKVCSAGEKACQPPITGRPEPDALSNDPNYTDHFIRQIQDMTTVQTEDLPGDGTTSHNAKVPLADSGEAPQTAWSLSGHKMSTLADTMKEKIGQHPKPDLKKDLCGGNEQLPEKEMVSTKEGVLNRGLADGGDKRCQKVRQHTPLMANGEKEAVHRVKKRLLVTIGSAVEKIISHFNSSRNQVQKTQLGDSRLSPALGYLVLKQLCPSLYLLLADGLKPFQKDVIIGRRRLSPWSLVEASSKTGPSSLLNLFNKVNNLQQLRDPQRRFNSFVYGLLNMKHLDVWVSHLLATYDQLAIFFLPHGFLPLAASHPELGEELLLTLQPLSALTFHIDLLFEHHHLQLQDLPDPLRSPNHRPVNWGLPTFQQLLDIGGWITHSFTGNAEREATSLDHSPKSTMRTSYEEPVPTDCPQPSPGTVASSNNWWEHLNQTSRAYTPAKRDSFSITAVGRLTSRELSDCQNKPSGSSNDLESAEQSDGEKNHIVPKDCPSDPGLRQSTTRAKLVQPKTPSQDHHSTDEKGNWLGQLFGANSFQGQEMVKSRRPSSWLPPNINVWNLLGKTSTSENPGNLPPDPAVPQQKMNQKVERTLRALCDHVASAETQLSFKKGDVLQLLGNVDDDWIRCSHGSDTGLVPVGYTSLIL